LQMVVWTIIIIPAFSVSVLTNLALGHGGVVQIPPELLALMGISAGSLVGSPAVTSTIDITFMGSVPEGRSPSFIDIFTGEKRGQENSIDIGKSQMFLFSIVLMTIYVYKIVDMFSSESAGAISTLPDMGGGLVTLLGISHAGYLVYKKAGPWVDPGGGQNNDGK